MSKVFMSFVLLFSFGTVSTPATEQSSRRQLKKMEDEALTAERERGYGIPYLWNQLALSEIAAGLPSKAVQHERHAIREYSKADVRNRCNVLGPLASMVIPALACGHAAEAEKLMIKAVEQAKLVAGPKSIVVQAQIADLFVFYVNQKNYKAALKSLDQALDFDLTIGATPSQLMIQSLPCTTVALQPNNSVDVLHMILLAISEHEKTECSFAITAIGKILKAQEAGLAAGDERLLETLGAFGDAYFQAKKYNEADSYYSRAYEITKKYYFESGTTVRMCGQNFLANLKEIGQSKEADRLSKLEWQGFRTLKPTTFRASSPSAL